MGTGWRESKGELKVVDLSKAQKAGLLEIARQQMVSVELRGDLEERENDAEDWLEVSVWSLRSALEQAYLLGLEDARK